MQGQGLLTVHDLEVVQTERKVPDAGGPHHHGHGGQHFQRLLVNKIELRFIQWFAAQANTQGIEHHILFGVGVRDVGDLCREKLIETGGHSEILNSDERCGPVPAGP